MPALQGGGGEGAAAAEEVIEVPMNSGVAAGAKPACAALDWSLDNQQADDNNNNNNNGTMSKSGKSKSSKSSPASSPKGSSSPPMFSRSSSWNKQRHRAAAAPRYASRGGAVHVETTAHRYFSTLPRDCKPGFNPCTLHVISWFQRLL